MTKYITGEKILDSWDINKFDLFDHVRQGLRAFKKITRHTFECPPKYNLKTKLKNIDQWIAQLENPNFPKNLENYHDEERLTGIEHSILLNEMKQDRAKIIGKLESIQLESIQLESIQSGKNINDLFSWYYCDLPESEQKASAVINSVVESLFLKKDVAEILGPPKKGSKLKIAGNSNQKKLRHDQMCRIKCRDIAKRIWAKDPTITIADMTNEDEIVKASTKKNGKLYTEKTVRNWIKDLCPDREPGRRPKKKS